MDLWNCRDLNRPPINSCKTNVKEIDVKLLHNVIKQGIEYFENQDHLNTEAALLSRTIYRMKMKFRNAKDFKAIEKLNRALLIYLNIDTQKTLKSFLESVPQNYKLNKTYLPTKNMIDYILVRLQGLGKLLWRILETCKVAAKLAQQRIHLGHFWKVALIVYGIVSRVFIVSRKMIKYTCDLYSNLRPFSEKLKNTGTAQWLPQDYLLPEYLNEWLDIDWLDLDQTIIEIPDNEPPILSFFNLIDDDSDDDIEVCDEYIVVNDDEPSVISLESDVSDNNVDFIPLDNADVKKQINFIGFEDDVDVGEVVTETTPNTNISNGTEVDLTQTKRNKKNRRKGKSKFEFINGEVATEADLILNKKKKKRKSKFGVNSDVGEVAAEKELSPAKLNNKIKKKSVVSLKTSSKQDKRKKTKDCVIGINDSFVDKSVIDLSTPQKKNRRKRKRKYSQNNNQQRQSKRLKK